ncbi:MAG: acyl carrier protein [Lachnospiraceae bacterium]|nr:acyl carrier protein [Lachnospiraceae bacterium]
MQVKENELKNILAKLFKVSVDSINDDSSMDNVKEWDSLNHLKLVLAIEDELDISFTEQESVEILSFALIKEILKEHNIEVVA